METHTYSNAISDADNSTMGGKYYDNIITVVNFMSHFNSFNSQHVRVVYLYNHFSLSLSLSHTHTHTHTHTRA